MAGTCGYGEEPVQGCTLPYLSACTRVQFTLPQCLYKGDLYLYLYTPTASYVFRARRSIANTKLVFKFVRKYSMRLHSPQALILGTHKTEIKLRKFAVAFGPIWNSELARGRATHTVTTRDD